MLDEDDDLPGHPDGTQPVLVVDDDQVIRGILRAHLIALEQTPIIAANGLEALRYARATHLSLIVLDLHMPVLNGLQTIEQLRRISHHQSTPVIMLTSERSQPAAAAALRAGVTDFLTKPFVPMEVMLVLKKYLPLTQAVLANLEEDAARAARIAKLHHVWSAGATHAQKNPGMNPSQAERARRLIGILRC